MFGACGERTGEAAGIGRAVVCRKARGIMCVKWKQQTERNGRTGGKTENKRERRIAGKID